MNWYITKLVYQIVCGTGNHTAQFDEQLRLISAANEEAAFDKAMTYGREGAESFCNAKSELVQWRFINVAELYKLSELLDGAELYSRIAEVEDAEAYRQLVHKKAASIQEKTFHQLLQLI